MARAMVPRGTTRTIKEPTKETSHGMEARREVVWQVVAIVVDNINIIEVTHGTKSQQTRWSLGLM